VARTVARLGHPWQGPGTRGKARAPVARTDGPCHAWPSLATVLAAGGGALPRPLPRFPRSLPRLPRSLPRLPEPCHGPWQGSGTRGKARGKARAPVARPGQAWQGSGKRGKDRGKAREFHAHLNPHLLIRHNLLLITVAKLQQNLRRLPAGRHGGRPRSLSRDAETRCKCRRRSWGTRERAHAYRARGKNRAHAYRAPHARMPHVHTHAYRMLPARTHARTHTHTLQTHCTHKSGVWLVAQHVDDDLALGVRRDRLLRLEPLHKLPVGPQQLPSPRTPPLPPRSSRARGAARGGTAARPHRPLPAAQRLRARGGGAGALRIHGACGAAGARRVCASRVWTGRKARGGRAPAG